MFFYWHLIAVTNAIRRTVWHYDYPFLWILIGKLWHKMNAFGAMGDRYCWILFDHNCNILIVIYKEWTVVVCFKTSRMQHFLCAGFFNRSQDDVFLLGIVRIWITQCGQQLNFNAIKMFSGAHRHTHTSIYVTRLKHFSTNSLLILLSLALSLPTSNDEWMRRYVFQYMLCINYLRRC